MQHNHIIGVLAIAGLLFSGCGKQEPEPTPAPGPSTVAVTGITVGSASLSLTEGGTGTISYSIAPSNATNQGVSFKSSDSSVASVDSNGKVTAGKPGTASITVTTADGGKTATCTVTVTAKTVAVTGVKLDKTTLSLTEGASQKLTATVEPGDATNKEVTWKSSDDKVATVGNDGTVTGVKAGEATISVTTKDGSKTATCKVTVTAKTIAVTGLTLNKSTISIVVEETFKLVPTIKPDDATNKEVEWKSSNTAVATVAEDGTVTGVKAGTATITCTTKDGSKKATCAVTVTAKAVAVTGLTLNKSTISIVVEETFKLVPTITPSNATNKEVEWKSSNTAVATVAEDGTVTAVKAGTATITCTTKDGGKKATCAVTVTAKAVAVTGVTLNKSSLTINTGETFKLVPTIKPDNATNKEVEWKSSNTAVATVAEDGTVTGVKAGNATITCTTKDQSKKATCSVTVKAATVAVTGVTLDKTTLTMNAGGTYTLKATVEPSNATDKSITWKTSDASIATVTNGKVTAVKKGTATITVTTRDGSKTATCEVTVDDPYSFWMTQGAGSSSNMVKDPYTYIYILGTNTGTTGDAMKFYVRDGSDRSFNDEEQSHYSIKVLSNDGSIEAKLLKDGKRYYYVITFKKNGHAKVQLIYNNGEGVSASHEVHFDIYQDGSKKWKFRMYTPGSGIKDFSGNITHTLTGDSTKDYTWFEVTDLSNKNIEDLEKSHYTINNWWADVGNTTITTGIYSQAGSGDNWWTMFFYYKKTGSTYVELNYTDGVSMITTGNFMVYVK